MGNENRATLTKLQEMWSSMLKRDLEPCDDFYESGGDSLMTIDSLEQITVTFGVDLTLEEFFENSALEQCADLIDKKLRSSNAAR